MIIKIKKLPFSRGCGEGKPFEYYLFKFTFTKWRFDFDFWPRKEEPNPSRFSVVAEFSKHRQYFHFMIMYDKKNDKEKN